MTAIDEADIGAETKAPPSTRGFGLRHKLESLTSYSNMPELTPSQPEPPPTPPAQQIIIAAGAQTSEIDRLAAYVARGGPREERKERLKTAVKIITVSAKDDIDKTQLAKSLDDKLFILEGEQPAGSPFDFIHNFLNPR